MKNLKPTVEPLQTSVNDLTSQLSGLKARVTELQGRPLDADLTTRIAALGKDKHPTSYTFSDYAHDIQGLANLMVAV